MKRYKAHISCENGSGYQLVWKSKKDFKNFSPTIDEFNFYSDAQEDDILVPISESNLKFSINEQEPLKNKNTFEICFSGDITFELNKKDYKSLEDKEFSIDYLMTFVDHGGESAESDEDYELIANQNIVLKDIKEIG